MIQGGKNEFSSRANVKIISSTESWMEGAALQKLQ
jgi:hypothetical protein